MSAARRPPRQPSTASSRPRIVYICPFSPIPRDWGGAIRFDSLWRALRDFADVDLVILGDRPPLHVRRVLDQAGAVVFPPRIETPVRRATRVLRAFVAGECIPAARFLSRRRISRLVTHVESRRPDAIVLGFEYLSALIPALRPLGIPIIVDAHNAASRGHARVAAASRDLATKLSYWIMERNAKRWEREFLPLADRLWTVSRSDAEYYAGVLGRSAAVVPNVVRFEEIRRDEEEPGSVVFTGLFAYWPNEDAALRLVAMSDDLHREGLLRTLYLVGKDPTPRMRTEAARRPHVVVTGAVPDVLPWVRRASVFAAPLAAGSGTKLKILEAFSQERPVITTEIGAEGLDLVPGVHAEVVSSTKFQEALRRLLRDPSRRAAIASSGRKLGAYQFSQEAMQRAVFTLVSDVLAGPRSARD